MCVCVVDEIVVLCVWKCYLNVLLRVFKIRRGYLGVLGGMLKNNWLSCFSYNS